MIEDVRLRLVKRKIENKEIKEGEVKEVVLVLKGCDLANGVEWSVTLKAEEQMPALYRKTIGAHIGDNIVVSLGKSTRQTELREMKAKLCPRCKSVHWKKRGSPYLNRYGVSSQLWKCKDCGYTGERFAE